MKSRCNTPLMLNSDYIIFITLFWETGYYIKCGIFGHFANDCKREIVASSVVRRVTRLLNARGTLLVTIVVKRVI